MRTRLCRHPESREQIQRAPEHAPQPSDCAQFEHDAEFEMAWVSRTVGREVVDQRLLVDSGRPQPKPHGHCNRTVVCQWPGVGIPTSAFEQAHVEVTSGVRVGVFWAYMISIW